LGAALAGVSLIIPVLDEEATVAAVVRAIPRDVVDEIIVADGGSRDATVTRARVAGAMVIVAAHPGYGGCCQEGVQRAAAAHQVIAFIDGDGSDDPDELRRIVEPIIKGEADFVIGSRVRGERVPGSMSPHQVMAGHLAGFALRALYGVRYSDMCPLRAIRRDALAGLGMREKTYGWNLEMQMRAARAGLRIQEIPVRHRLRAGGKSKVAGSVKGTLKASWRILTTLIRVAAERS
jgi:glycosyltransferase involved in cell wall biosynthesis